MSVGYMLDQLTPREKQILALIGEGYSLPEIAARLHRSIKTIETHRLTLGRKLKATNRVELARIAFMTGLVSLDTSQVTSGHGAVQEKAPSAADDATILRNIREIDRRVGPARGAAYLRRLICALTEVLEFEYAGIRDLQKADQKLQSRGLFVARNGDVCDVSTEMAEDGPCSATVEKGWHICLCNAAEKYPNAPTMQQVDAQSYLGYRLDAEDGCPLGVLWLAHTQPFDSLDCYADCFG